MSRNFENILNEKPRVPFDSQIRTQLAQALGFDVGLGSPFPNEYAKEVRENMSTIHAALYRIFELVFETGTQETDAVDALVERVQPIAECQGLLGDRGRNTAPGQLADLAERTLEAHQRLNALTESADPLAPFTLAAVHLVVSDIGKCRKAMKGDLAADQRAAAEDIINVGGYSAKARVDLMAAKALEAVPKKEGQVPSDKQIAAAVKAAARELGLLVPSKASNDWAGPDSVAWTSKAMQVAMEFEQSRIMPPGTPKPCAPNPDQSASLQVGPRAITLRYNPLLGPMSTDDIEKARQKPNSDKLPGVYPMGGDWSAETLLGMFKDEGADAGTPESWHGYVLHRHKGHPLAGWISFCVTSNRSDLSYYDFVSMALAGQLSQEPDKHSPGAQGQGYAAWLFKREGIKPEL